MSLPILPNTQIFEQDQRAHFKARYWNQTSTAVRLGPGIGTVERYVGFGTGVEFALFDLLTSAFAPTTRAEIETALADTSKTASVLGYSGANYRSGVVPTIYKYWGSGAPDGGRRARQVLMKYTGYVTETLANGTLVLAGQGTVQVYLTPAGGGTTVQIAAGTLKEPEAQANLNGVTATTVKNEWGYVVVDTRTYNYGDKLEIYYWHNGEPWGGIAAKIIPRAVTLTSNDLLVALRDAPFVGASFITKDLNGVSAVDLKYITDADLKVQEGAVPELRIDVALAAASEPTGYSYTEVNGEKLLIDNANPVDKIQKGRLIHFEGGFRAPDGTEELYPRFTGFIDDITPEGGDRAAIVVRGFEGQSGDVFDENTPDRLSYQAFGYILRENTVDPVYGIPAYDNWPLEVAVHDLLAHAGIDSYNFLGHTTRPQANTNVGKARFRTVAEGIERWGERLASARSLTGAELVRLERQTNYGNVMPLKKDFLPNDAEYLFKPQVNQRVYDRVRSLCNQYGYDFYFNAEGLVVLTGRNNPVGFQYFTKNGKWATNAATYRETHVDAVGGDAYVQTHMNGVFSKVLEGYFARADLYTGIGLDASRGLNGGILSVLIETLNSVGAVLRSETVTFDTYTDPAQLPEGAWYYDNATRADGSNAAVFRLPLKGFDHYRITITKNGWNTTAMPAATDAVYRLNGVAIYERDPESSSFYAADGTVRKFSTLKNTLRVTGQSSFKDLRNKVVTVGSRKATITDSAKVDNAGANPNNPDYEFHVSVSVDPYSIYDPTAANFVGQQKMAVIFDDKVTDSDFAKWLTRTVLFRYRMPQDPAKFSNTVLPMLELRDACHAVDERNKSINHLVWVTGFTERWNVNGVCTTDVDGVAYPEIPSYQPREDIDIDTLFVDPADGKGEPLINFEVSYKNIFGRVVSNVNLFDDGTIKGFKTRAKGSSQPMQSVALTLASVTPAYPVIPETMYLSMGISHDPASKASSLEWSARGYGHYRRRVLINNPYRQFYHITGWNASHQPTVAFDFQEADGTAGVYDAAYYDFPNLNSKQWYLNFDYIPNRYKADGTTPAENPFYDPYTSEVGNFVTTDFTLLVSGRVRVSVWAHSEAENLDVPVAWLTAPTASGEEPDAHWIWSDAGKQSFVWDGIDNIGLWNILQSADLGEELTGAFGEKPMAVGKGHYAWNDKGTNRFTLIGDHNTWGTEKFNYDNNNAPFYTIGQFGQFYVKVEVANDALLRKDFVNGKTNPRTVDSRALPTTSGWNSTSKTWIWSHLPADPTQVAIRIEDWADASAWTPGMTTTALQWSAYSTPDADASLKVGKPVRITFVPIARRGMMFANATHVPQKNLISAKLTRRVDLKATVFDQFWSFSGKKWEGYNQKWAEIVSGVEKKRLHNRMYHNTDHTLEFEDSAYRTGDSIAALEWIFDPSMFEKDFGSGQREKLRFGDYDQLEVIPGMDKQQLGGTAAATRAYMLSAFMSYLFYFSAFTMDRSGRRQWCLNSWTDTSGNKRGWIDKTKIVTPTRLLATDDPAGGTNYRPQDIVQYETRAASRYLARSLFVRQWKETYWADPADTRSPISKYAVSDLNQRKYTQFKLTDLELSQAVHPMAGNATDNWLVEYARTGAGVVQNIRYRGSFNRGAPANTKAVINPFSATPTMALGAYGTWNFQRPGVETFFTPNPCRDFHPYFRAPFMPEPLVAQLSDYLNHSGLGSEDPMALSALESAASHIHHGLRDHAANEEWFGYAFGDSFALSYYNFYTAKTEAQRRWYYGARLEKGVESILSEGTNEKDDTDMWADKVQNMYDYSKRDDLDRFDQFRGVIGRGPYATRSTDPYLTIYDLPKARSGPSAPVKPSGVLLLNTARYKDYWILRSHNLLDMYIHGTTDISSWFDIRFSHEYVWYSARYFPVMRSGGAVYMYFRDEDTGVSRWISHPWEGGPAAEAFDPTKDLYYDAGAWVGWKPDGWLSGTRKYLNWKETWPTAIPSVKDGAGMYGTGGAEPEHAATGLSTATYNQIVNKDTAPVTHRRINIFDEYYSKPRRARLAVGPDLAEARALWMNLTLSDKMKGV